MALTSVSATVDKNPVVANESFVLEIVADDSLDNNALDTSPLLEDFIVGRTSVSSQTSMVNFNTTRTTRFQTMLIAKKTGTVIIPPLTVDGLKTDPITLTVLAKSDAAANNQKDLFITTEISNEEVYVQQQLTLTVKLHFALELKRGSLSEPTLDSASIKQIGQDKEQDTIINGRRFRVIERTYAISPQQSGEFTIQSPIFSGEVMIQSARRSNFLSFGETKPVSVIGDNIALNVKPIPDSYQGDWLPSEILTVHEEWQPDLGSFKVGEPITRVITLTAAGLSEEQLPKINMPMKNGLKVYPDQAELHTGMNRGRMVSQKVKNFAVVASRAGEFTLPEIRIPWWNTVTNRYQVATIPAQTVTVSENLELQEENQISMSTSAPASNAKPVTVTVIEHSKLQWLFLVLWLTTSLAWFISARRKSVLHNMPSQNLSRKKHTARVPLDDNKLYLNLLAACKKNEGKEAIRLLLPWLNQLAVRSNSAHIGFDNLDDAIEYLGDKSLLDATRDLQRVYFGKEADQKLIWNGDNLSASIQTLNISANKVRTKQDQDFSITP